MTQQDRLRQFAKQQGMTHAQLAAKLELSRESVSRILSGKERVTPALIGRFFVAFGPEAASQVFQQDISAQPAEVPA